MAGSGNDFRNEPSRLERFVLSHASRLMLDPRLARLQGWSFELRRRITGARQRVDYFHQVDDPYSVLAVQAAAAVAAAYDIELVPHLVRASEDSTNPEPELLKRHASRDCAGIAKEYGLEFPVDPVAPSSDEVEQVEAVLAAALGSSSAFLRLGAECARGLWSRSRAPLSRGSEGAHAAGEADVASALADGNALRARLGHYSGAMFHHAGRWYWGVDRLVHLEARLRELGTARAEGLPLFPRPEVEMARVARPEGLRLEIFASLRSPYTAIGFQPALDLARNTGIAHVVRPVLPMVMRGVPVPFSKARYIMRDTLREAAALGMPFGKLYDPVGEPVRRGYALWSWARSHGRGDAFFASFLSAAFAEGIDTARAAGLRVVVERAGLDWASAREHLGDRAWEGELEANRRMLIDELGEWGVPSFRLKGPAGRPDLIAWGQDRLWWLSREIQRRGNDRGGAR